MNITDIATCATTSSSATQGTAPERPVKGRFAPSPTGRMHLGNVYAALMSWLSARSAGGTWLLRIEDLDPQRSRPALGRQLEDDLLWLGLEWDEGGMDGSGPAGPYCQSRRSEIYLRHLERLQQMGLTYRCRCTRADILATQAPHESDGRVVYAGTCRPAPCPPFPQEQEEGSGAVRLFVPDRDICFTDRHFGARSVNLSRHCGDFVVRRADGAWAYQLAVVVDDALMGVTEVVRGCDLLLSTAQQRYLASLLGITPPQTAHLPLLSAPDGRRLSKREASLSMEHLRQGHTGPQVVGLVAWLAGLTDEPGEWRPEQLTDLFRERAAKICRNEKIIVNLPLL